MYLSRRNSQILASLVVVAFVAVGAFLLSSQEGAVKETPLVATQTVTSGQNAIPEIETQKALPTESPSESETLSQPSDQPVEEVELPQQAGEAFSLERFERSETVDGKLLWKIVGENAQYFPEKNSVLIRNCDLFFATEKEEAVRIRSKEASIALKDASLSRADLSGEVSLDYENGKVVINSDKAAFLQEERKISVEGPVQIKSQWYEVKGIGLSADLETKEFKILKDVDSTIKPRNNV